MTYVRSHQVNGHVYYSLVRSMWTSRGPRQKYIRYLGKYGGAVHSPVQPRPPMLAKPMIDSSILDSPDWYANYKYDGTRVLAFKDKGRVNLVNRRGIDYTDRFPEIAAELRQLPASVDGEFVYFDKRGNDQFIPVQRRTATTDARKQALLRAEYPITYMVFDVFEYKGGNVASLPLFKRVKLLKRLFRGKRLKYIKPVSYKLTGKREWLRELKGRSREGLILKEKSSAYQFGKRSGDWRKAKNWLSDEFIVTGFKLGSGRRKGKIGALSLAQYHKGKLRYAGDVGSGFDEKELFIWTKRLKERPKKRFIIEVRYYERSKNGILRHPVFLRERLDKKPSDVMWNSPY